MEQYFLFANNNFWFSSSKTIPVCRLTIRNDNLLSDSINLKSAFFFSVMSSIMAKYCTTFPFESNIGCPFVFTQKFSPFFLRCRCSTLNGFPFWNGMIILSNSSSVVSSHLPSSIGVFPSTSSIKNPVRFR